MTLLRFTEGAHKNDLIDVVDADCEFRPCFVFGFDKGPFVQGQGYTRPETPWRKVCFQRHMSGCPHVAATLRCEACHTDLGVAMYQKKEGEPDWLPPIPVAQCPECGSNRLYYLANVLNAPKMCCEDPRVAKPRKGVPMRQTCKSCGTTLRGGRLAIAQERSWV